MSDLRQALVKGENRPQLDKSNVLILIITDHLNKGLSVIRSHKQDQQHSQ